MTVTSNLVIQQRIEGDYVTCMSWVGPRDANEIGRQPGHCMAIVPLIDGDVPAKCPFGHTLPWYGTETGSAQPVLVVNVAIMLALVVAVVAVVTNVLL